MSERLEVVRLVAMTLAPFVNPDKDHEVVTFARLVGLVIAKLGLPPVEAALDAFAAANEVWGLEE